MNVLMLGHQYRNYGTYWRLFFLARGLVKLGHHVTLACVSLDSRWKSKITIVDGVTIWEGPNWLHDLPGQGTGPLDILGRIKLVRSKAWDIIHGFEFLPNVRIPMYQKLRCKKTVVISDWCDWYSQAGLGPKWGKVPGVKQIIARQEDAVRRKVHGVTVISRLLEKRSQQLVNSQDRVRYLPGGAPIDVIQPQNKEKCRHQWKIALDKKVIGFVGTNQEDLDILAKAFIFLIKEIPNSLLFLIGPGNDGVTALFKQHGLQDYIKISGKFDYSDLATMMGCCDVFALPLRDTQGNAARWPNKIGEYLSAGRPVVTSNAGEMKSFFKNHAIGTACNNDPAAFARELSIYLKNIKLSEKVGAEARKIAETVLAWDVLSGELEAFYKKMITVRS